MPQINKQKNQNLFAFRLQTKATDWDSAAASEIWSNTARQHPKETVLQLFSYTRDCGSQDCVRWSSPQKKQLKLLKQAVLRLS